MEKHQDFLTFFVCFYRHRLLAYSKRGLRRPRLQPGAKRRPRPPPVLGLGLQDLQTEVRSRGPPPRRHHARAETSASSQRGFWDTAPANLGVHVDCSVTRGRSETAQSRDPEECYRLHRIIGKDTQQLERDMQTGQRQNVSHYRSAL